MPRMRRYSQSSSWVLSSSGRTMRLRRRGIDERPGAPLPRMAFMKNVSARSSAVWAVQMRAAARGVPNCSESSLASLAAAA